jgi:hypothetical protein
MLKWSEDTIQLLIGEREERFKFERAIRLLEFRTWIYWPLTNKHNTAGMMAAALLLENIEDDIFIDEAALAWDNAKPDDPWSSAKPGKPVPMINLDDKPAPTLRRISVLRADETYRGCTIIYSPLAAA